MLTYRQFMYYSLPDPKNSGRRLAQGSGVPIYRWPQARGYIEMYVVDNPLYTHKIVRNFDGKDFITWIKSYGLTQDIYFNGSKINIHTNFRKESDLLIFCSRTLNELFLG